MKNMNRFIKLLYAIISVVFIYNLKIFQDIIIGIRLNNIFIILLLSILSYVLIFIIDAVIDFIITYFLESADKGFVDSIKKSEPFNAMKHLIRYNLLIDIYMLLSPNLYYKCLHSNDKIDFFSIINKNIRLTSSTIIHVLTNYVLITSSIYILYMKTNYISKITSFIKKLDLSSYISILKILIEPKYFGIILLLLTIIIYARKKNKIKEIIKNDDKSIEEDVLLKIKELNNYFMFERTKIINNLYVLIKHKRFFMDDESVIIYERGIYYKNSILLKSVNNAEKLKSLIKYFLYDINCKYYFAYKTTESSFLLLYSQLNNYLNTEHVDNVLDILFNTDNYINNRLKILTNEKEYLYVEEINYALSILTILSSFTDEFRKYTKAGIVNKEFLQNLSNILDIINYKKSNNLNDNKDKE